MSPGSCPRGVTFGALGVPRGSKNFKHGHVAYQTDGDDEQNRMQVKFLSYCQTGHLRGEVKRSNIINFDYHVNSKIFIPNFVCVLTNKILKTY